jgi:CO/xanthine dehydrogenase Mo-binding subunit
MSVPKGLYPADATYPPPPYRLIGKWSGRRLDAESKVTGRWRLGNDTNQPSLAWMALKLSPISAGTITAVDASAAKKIPGVLMVLTSDDIKNDPVLSKLKNGQYQLLPFDQIRYVGQEVAAVAAEDPYIAEEACQAINITYNKLPFVNHVSDAMKSNAPQVWAGTPNLQAPTTYKFGDADAAMAASGVTVFSSTFESNDVHNNPIANMAGTVNVVASGRPEIWMSTQGCKGGSSSLASLVGIPASRARAYGSNTDGSFGGKSGGAHMQLATIFSQRLGRPVHWMVTREHDLLNGARHPRDVFNVSAAYKSDGTVTALKVDLYNNTGAGKSAGVATASGSAAKFYNVYKFPNFTVNAYEVWTNYVSPAAYRNPPGPHAAFAAAVFLDMIAAKLGMNPVTFLQKNSMYVAGDKNQLNGYPFYSIGQPDCLNKVLSLSNFNAKWKAAPTSQTGLKGVIHGIGIANTASGLGSTASSHGSVVQMLSDGSLQCSQGGTDIGNGRTEQERLIAAEMMGLPIEYVTINNYDSDFIGDTGGTNGSSQTKGAGNPLALACYDAKKQMLAKAATALSTTVDLLTYALDGSMKIFLTADPTKSVSFASLTGDPTIIGVGHMIAPTGYAANVFDSCVAEVDVDTDTGLVKVTDLYQVQDVGRVIHRQSITGQMHQAMTSALGQAIQEDHWVDAPTGSPLAISHLDTKVPLFTQIPNIVVDYVEDAEAPPLSYNFGAKGMGEPPMDAPIPAIINAVANAIGWWCPQLPVTPDRVLKALGKA